MNLFRSKEHVKKWTGFKENTEEGIVRLSEMVALFSGSLFKRRLDPDYMTHFQEYLGEMIATASELGKTKRFWAPEPS